MQSQAVFFLQTGLSYIHLQRAHSSIDQNITSIYQIWKDFQCNMKYEFTTEFNLQRLLTENTFNILKPIRLWQVFENSHVTGF